MGVLTKREQFAMAAMQGMLSNPEYCSDRTSEIIEQAVYFADELLSQVSETKNKDQADSRESDLGSVVFMREKDVLKLVPFGRCSLWKFSKDGTFPAPIKISSGISAWREKDVLEWLETLAGK